MMTVGDLKKFLEGVKDDSLPLLYLPPDVDLGSSFGIKGALLVDKTTSDERVKKLNGLYLLED